MAKNEKDKQTTAHTTQHRKLKNKQHEPHQKLGGDLRCSGRVSRSCSTCGTRRVAYVIINPVNSLNSVGHIREREGDCSYDVRNISDIICETVIP